MYYSSKILYFLFTLRFESFCVGNCYAVLSTVNIYCLWFYKTIFNSLVQIKISFLWDVCVCVCVYIYIYIYVCMYVEYTVYLRCICGMSFSYFKLRKIVIGGFCQNKTENTAWLQKYTVYLSLMMFYSVHFIFNFYIYFMGHKKVTKN